MDANEWKTKKELDKLDKAARKNPRNSDIATREPVAPNRRAKRALASQNRKHSVIMAKQKQAEAERKAAKRAVAAIREATAGAEASEAV